MKFCFSPPAVDILKEIDLPNVKLLLVCIPDLFQNLTFGHLNILVRMGYFELLVVSVS